MKNLSSDHRIIQQDTCTVVGAKRIVFLRHGQTDFNVQRRFQGIVNQPLNEVGCQQAQTASALLAGWLALRQKQRNFTETDEGNPAVRIVCSPLLRAAQTAQIISGVFAEQGLLEGDVLEDSAFIERSYGVFEGQTLEEAMSKYPEYVAQWRETGESIEAGVEASDRVGQRMMQAALSYARGVADGGTLIVVSHGSAIVRALIVALGLSPLEFDGLRGLENCHWSEIVLTGGGGSGASGGLSWRLGVHGVGQTVMGAC
ncbi:histidine phosphatase family protein [Schaalia sp. lx-100]|uniref:histidine phosphatase family protein n=1 Tax=Schaalia sp. lx-100 TaxID=2899081 RepID=UPI001E3AF0AE|nr:histidine phosphatase family protein [Schaalia sp. lx-100]MCD4557353.1 histidine phosphatase family protein [Schaalia sp. lx-100]